MAMIKEVLWVIQALFSHSAHAGLSMRLHSAELLKAGFCFREMSTDTE